MRVTIKILQGQKILAEVSGRNIENVLINDLHILVMIERFLERMTGLRFHIDVENDATWTKPNDEQAEGRFLRQSLEQEVDALATEAGRFVKAELDRK